MHFSENWVYAAALVGGLTEACKKTLGLDLIIHTKPKTDEGGEQMDALLHAVRDSDENSAIIGLLTKVQILLPPCFSDASNLLACDSFLMYSCIFCKHAELCPDATSDATNAAYVAVSSQQCHVHINMGSER